MFSLNSANSVTKICHSVKGFEPLPPSHLLCNGAECYRLASTTHVRDRNFKLNPIHASMIISFPEFVEFSESYAPFRKNSIHPTNVSSIIRKFGISKLYCWGAVKHGLLGALISHGCNGQMK